MMTKKIVLVPIDSRPVTYSFPQLVASVAGLTPLSPPLELMGNLHVPANRDELYRWLEDVLLKEHPDEIFLSLDSLIYGGLVASRCSHDSLSQVTEIAERIAELKKLRGDKSRIYAHASVMRIPHYNTTNTEPPYWQGYGEKIFNWSLLEHKRRLGVIGGQEADLRTLENHIPKDAFADFLKRRERNFKVNQCLIEMAKAGTFEHLAFGQDDTSAFGLNVWEKTKLVELAATVGAKNVIAYPGTDETILVLLAKWFIEKAGAPKASVVFSPDCGKDVLSNFEGQAIAASLAGICGVIGLDLEYRPAAKDDDFTVIVHTAARVQGDHLGIASKRLLDTSESVKRTLELIESAPVSVVLCDVAYSNGADPLLIESLLKRRDLMAKLCAYAGWNTTNNTIGSGLALGVARWYAKIYNNAADEPLKQALFVRFADDWAYQAKVRSAMASNASQYDNSTEDHLNKLMSPLIKQLKSALSFDPEPVTLRLPWKRSFEVEVGLPSQVQRVKS
jgi:hypothetical protein